MNRTRKNGMKFVISFRVNHQEKEALALLAEKSGRSISSLIRSNLEMLDSEVNASGLMSS